MLSARTRMLVGTAFHLGAIGAAIVVLLATWREIGEGRTLSTAITALETLQPGDFSRSDFDPSSTFAVRNVKTQKESKHRARLIVVVGPACPSCSQVADTWARTLTARRAEGPCGVSLIRIGEAPAIGGLATAAAEAGCEYDTVVVHDLPMFQAKTGVLLLPTTLLYEDKGPGCIITGVPSEAALSTCADVLRRIGPSTMMTTEYQRDAVPLLPPSVGAPSDAPTAPGTAPLLPEGIRRSARDVGEGR